MTSLEAMHLSPLPVAPLVSILMANRNYAHYIDEAIGSVTGQTYHRLELVVCDDGSDDESVAVVERAMANDSRVKLVRHCQSGGMAAALNTAFRSSSGEIICFLDSDDTYPPNKVASIVDCFRQNQDAGIVVHPLRIINADGQPLGSMPFRTKRESGWIGGQVVARGGRWGNMPGGGTCLRRELAEHIFPIPEERFTRSADAFIYTVAPLLAGVESVQEPLYFYRIHGDNDMQRLLRDENTSRDEVRSISASVQACNTRIAELGIQGVELKLTDNLNFLQHHYLLGMFASHSRLSLAREYWNLARRLANDDLYRLHERCIRIALYGIALPLPLRLRRPLLLSARSPRRIISFAVLRAKSLVRSHRT